jgi:hypothetical protein
MLMMHWKDISVKGEDEESDAAAPPPEPEPQPALDAEPWHVAVSPLRRVRSHAYEQTGGARGAAATKSTGPVELMTKPIPAS